MNKIKKILESIRFYRTFGTLLYRKLDMSHFENIISDDMNENFDDFNPELYIINISQRVIPDIYKRSLIIVLFFIFMGNVVKFMMRYST